MPLPTIAEMDELHEQAARARRRMLRATEKRLTAALTNTAGPERLRAVSDEEWAEAQAESDAS